MSDSLNPAVPVAEGRPARRGVLAGMGAVAAGGGLLALAGAPAAEATVAKGRYYSYGPFRIVDSRQTGGRLHGGSTRTLSTFSGLEDYTFAVNLTVVDTKGSGFLAVYNADLTNRPGPYSSINWQGDNKTIANFNNLDLGAAGAKIYCSGGSSTSTHFIIDVVGYFYDDGAAVAAPPGFAEWERRARRSQG